MKKRRRVVIALIFGLLGLIPLAPVLAQDDPASAADEWSAEFSEENSELDITENELRFLNQFRKKYPFFWDKDLVTILNFRRSHPDFDDEDLDMFVAWHGKYPGFNADDMSKFHRLHNMYPEFGLDNLGQLNRFHNENPWFGMEELGRVYKFHVEHPWIDAKHLGDMLIYWDKHHKAPARPLEQAYADYKQDPKAFRRKHKIERPANAQPPANRKGAANSDPDD